VDQISYPISKGIVKWGDATSLLKQSLAAHRGAVWEKRMDNNKLEIGLSIHHHHSLVHQQSNDYAPGRFSQSSRFSFFCHELRNLLLYQIIIELEAQYHRIGNQATTMRWDRKAKQQHGMAA